MGKEIFTHYFGQQFEWHDRVLIGFYARCYSRLEYYETKFKLSQNGLEYGHYFDDAFMILQDEICVGHCHFEQFKHAYQMLKTILYRLLIDAYRKNKRGQLKKKKYLNTLLKRNSVQHIGKELSERAVIEFFYRVDRAIERKLISLQKREKEFYALYKSLLLKPGHPDDDKRIIMTKMSITASNYGKLKSKVENKIVTLWYQIAPIV